MSDHFALPVSPVKRRKVLSEIGNMSPGESRRKSLGFDLVRIVTSPSRSASGQASLEPLSYDPNITNRETLIPTLKNSERYSRLLSINENLSRRLKVNTQRSLSSPATSEVGDEESVILEELKSQLLTLVSEILLAEKALVELREESELLLSYHRALKTEIRMLRSVLREQELAFDTTLRRLTAKVESIEADVDHQLKEYERRAESTFNDAKFEIESEIEIAAAYEEPEVIQEFEQLQHDRSDLELKMTEALALRDQALAEEKQSFQTNQIAETSAHQELIKVQTAELKSLESNLLPITAELSALRQVFDDENASLIKMQAQITELENVMQHYTSERSRLEQMLAKESSAAETICATDTAWVQKVGAAKAQCDAEVLKLKAYLSTKKKLEHAIGKYATGPQTLTHGMNADFSEASFSLSDLTLPTTGRSPLKLWVSDLDLFVQDVFTGSNLSLIYFGIQAQQLQELQFILALYESSTHNVKPTIRPRLILQCIQFEQNGIVDLLNPSSEVEISKNSDRFNVYSQKMLVSCCKEIDNIISNLKFGKCPSWISVLFEVDGLKAGEIVSGQISMLNLTHLSLTEQIKLTNTLPSNSTLGSFVRQCQSLRPSFNLCQFERAESDESDKLLSLLQRVKPT